MESKAVVLPKVPTQQDFHNLRKEGVRPQIVACFIHKSQILLFFKKEHNIWQLPQGEIKEGENPVDALKRGMLSEVGEPFSGKCDFENAKLVYFDQVEFLPRKEFENMLVVDGKEVNLVGKAYYFYAIPVASPDIDLTTTQFDDSFWLDYTSALFLAKRMYQSGKRRITTGVLEVLKAEKVIR